MIFDQEMKYKVGDKLVLHSGKTVLVQKVDARHGEYHVLNIDDDEDFEIVKEREVVVNLGGYDNVMEMAVNESIEEAKKEDEPAEPLAEEGLGADDDDEDEEEVARLKALYNQLEEDAQKNAEKAKNIVLDAEKEADLIAEVVAADEELLRAQKEMAEAEAAIAELELAMLDPNKDIDEAVASLEKEIAEAEEAVSDINKQEETIEEPVKEEPVEEEPAAEDIEESVKEEPVKEETVEEAVREESDEEAVKEEPVKETAKDEPQKEPEESIIEEIILSEIKEEPVPEKAEPVPEKAEPAFEEAKPEEKEDPMAALRELYNSVPQVKCEALQKMTLMDDQLLRYSGWKEKSYAYGKNRRKRTLMKGWKQS